MNPHRNLLTNFRNALRGFTSSPSVFQVLRTVPPSSLLPNPQTLYILDSSFNPPTLAHHRIASSALKSHSNHGPLRLLLLLAVQNADKAPKPASLEQRLVMMAIFAQDLLDSIRKESSSDKEVDIAVDIGVTKLPYFMDKSAAVTSSGIYQSQSSSSSSSDPVEQVHLVGFDTIIRILDPKYYPPTHTLAPLDDLFARHRFRVTYRVDDDWGEREEQDRYLEDLREGKRVDQGGKREWAERIELVRGKEEREEIISSTKVREAARKNDGNGLRRLCTEGVAKWICDEHLYSESEDGKETA